MKNIAIVNTKGGVGKSVIAFHILPAILDGHNFEIIEIDNNNKTAETFLNTQILKGKITSLNIAEGTQKLEELVVTICSMKIRSALLMPVVVMIH